MKYLCKKHGEVSEIMQSHLPDYKGTWCYRCYLDLLGPQIEPVPEPEPEETPKPQKKKKTK